MKKAELSIKIQGKSEPVFKDIIDLPENWDSMSKFQKETFIDDEKTQLLIEVVSCDFLEK